MVAFWMLLALTCIGSIALMWISYSQPCVICNTLSEGETCFHYGRKIIK